MARAAATPSMRPHESAAAIAHVCDAGRGRRGGGASPPPPPKGLRTPTSAGATPSTRKRHGDPCRKARRVVEHVCTANARAKRPSSGFGSRRRPRTWRAKTLLKETHPDWTSRTSNPHHLRFSHGAGRPLAEGVTFCSKQQRQRFVDNDVGLDCRRYCRTTTLRPARRRRRPKMLRKKHISAAPVETAASRTDALLKKAQELRAGRLGETPATSPARPRPRAAPARHGLPGLGPPNTASSRA